MRTRGLPHWLMAAHGLVVGGVTTVVLLLPRYIVDGNTIPRGQPLAIAIGVGLVVATLLLLVGWRFNAARLRVATMVPIVLLIYFLLHLNGPLLDAIYSARPLVREMRTMPMPSPAPDIVAVFHTRRDVEYGIAFYRNQRVVNYQNDGVPLDAHVLIIRAGTLPEAMQLLGTRESSFLMHDTAQDLDVYWIAPAAHM
jgi:hypothetical protein